MEEAEIFIRRFISMDHLVRIAEWSEKDDAVFERQLKELNGMYHGEVDSEIYRGSPSDTNTFTDAKELIKGLQEKKLFRLEKLDPAKTNMLHTSVPLLQVMMPFLPYSCSGLSGRR